MSGNNLNHRSESVAFLIYGKLSPNRTGMYFVLSLTHFKDALVVLSCFGCFQITSVRVYTIKLNPDQLTDQVADHVL